MTELDELYAHYRRRLAEEAQSLDEIIARLLAGCDKAHADLGKFLHRIRGTAGTYEINTVADSASMLHADLKSGATAEALQKKAAALASTMRAEAALAEG